MTDRTALHIDSTGEPFEVPEYEDMPDFALAMLGSEGDRQALDLLMARRGGGQPEARHLKGHHDQSAHGHKGLGSAEMAATDAAMAEVGWRPETPGRFEAEYQKKMASAGLYSSMDIATMHWEQDGLPKGTRVFRKGRNRIYVHPDADVSDEDLQTLAKNVNSLSERFPKPGGVHIAVAPQSQFQWNEGGLSVRGKGEIRLSDKSVRGDWVGDYSEIGGGGKVAQQEYLVSHEWGHTLDTEDTLTVLTQALNAGPSTRYGDTKPVEAKAEAFADVAMHPAGNYAMDSTQKWVDMYPEWRP